MTSDRAAYTKAQPCESLTTKDSRVALVGGGVPDHSHLHCLLLSAAIFFTPPAPLDSMSQTTIHFGFTFLHLSRSPQKHAGKESSHRRMRSALLLPTVLHRSLRAPTMPSLPPTACSTPPQRFSSPLAPKLGLFVTDFDDTLTAGDTTPLLPLLAAAAAPHRKAEIEMQWEVLTVVVDAGLERA